MPEPIPPLTATACGSPTGGVGAADETASRSILHRKQSGHILRVSRLRLRICALVQELVLLKPPHNTVVAVKRRQSTTVDNVQYRGPHRDLPDSFLHVFGAGGIFRRSWARRPAPTFHDDRFDRRRNSARHLDHHDRPIRHRYPRPVSHSRRKALRVHFLGPGLPVHRRLLRPPANGCPSPSRRLSPRHRHEVGVIGHLQPCLGSPFTNVGTRQAVLKQPREGPDTDPLACSFCWYSSAWRRCRPRTTRPPASTFTTRWPPVTAGAT